MLHCQLRAAMFVFFLIATISQSALAQDMPREIAIASVFVQPTTSSDGSALNDLSEYRYEVWHGKKFVYEEAHAAATSSPEAGSTVSQVVGPFNAKTGQILTLVVYACGDVREFSVVSRPHFSALSAAHCSLPATSHAKVPPVKTEEPPIDPPPLESTIEIICKGCVIKVLEQ